MTRKMLLLQFAARSTSCGLALGAVVGLSGGFVVYLLSGSLPSAFYGGAIGLALGAACGGLFGGVSGIFFGVITVLIYYSRDQLRFYRQAIIATGVVVAGLGSYWLFSFYTSGYSYAEVGQASAAAPVVLVSSLIAIYGSYRMAKWYAGQRATIVRATH